MAIGLQELHASLRGHGRETPTGSAFFRLLGVDAIPGFELTPSQSAWQAARVLLFSVAMNEVRDAAEPSEAFASRVQEGFERAAAFLAKCSREGLEEWRVAGEKADIFIGGWLANEQLDLALPAGFLAEKE